MELKNIKYDPGFNNEESIKLAKATNSTELRDKVITNNISLVTKLVNKWINRGSTESREELMSMGLLGLVVAYDTYDIDRNIKFSSYAGKVVWMEFNKNARHLSMKCRGKYSKVSLSASFKNKQSHKKMEFEDIAFDPEYTSQYEIVENRLYEESLIKTLEEGFTEKEKYIATQYLIQGIPLVEIGKKLNVSRQTIHQGYKRSINKLSYFVV